MTTPPEPRVFVTQDTSLNLAKATRFGRLISLLPRNANITLSPQPTLRELKRKLDGFGDADHLLLLGDPLAIGLAIFVAAEMNVGRVRVLKWDKEMNDYYSVAVDLFDRVKKQEQ